MNTKVKISDLKHCLLGLIVIVMLLSATGCQIPYIIESAWIHLKIMNSKQDIQKALKNPDLPEEWKAKLYLTLEIRPYIEDLGLKITKNYQSFVDLKRPYISHLLIVTPAYSLKVKKWWFPIVGSFPYKGYHSEKKARKASEYYTKKNMDTYVRGVTAYSTLGWFNDPLLSTMMRYPDHDLVETIIHESVHATIFIKNNVDFNEQLAVFIARKATLAYYKNRSKKTYTKILEDQKDEDLFTDFLMQSYRKLKLFYKNKSSHTLKQKSELFEFIKQDYSDFFASKIINVKYDFVLKADLNNAFFAAQKTYHMNQKKFDSVYKVQGKNDIKEFIRLLKSLKSKKIIELFNFED